MLAGFDPLSKEQVGEPFELLAKARHELPVFYVPSLDVWCVTRMEDVLAVFKDTESYSNTHEEVGLPPAEFVDRIPAGHPVSHSLDAMDPPDHTRLRKLAQKAFTPRQLAAREPEIRNICMALVDEFIDLGEVDLVEAFTGRIPARVIAGVLGLDQEFAPTMKRWTDDWFAIWMGDDSQEMLRTRWERTIEFDGFIRKFVEERRARPQDDLTSALVHAKSDDGDPSMTTSEVISVIAGIVAAGSDTTSILLAYAFWLMLTHPDTWEAVKADPSQIPAAVEETLRLRNPVRGLRRVTTKETTLGGVTVPEGATLYVHVGSANRDEKVFDHPEEFRPGRPGISDHVGFGRWTHFCLGAPLARIEARIAIECVAERLPSLQLSGNQGELEYVTNAVVPAVEHLFVAWSPAPVGAAG
ncbi:MAG: cytochrome P450 [Solirubrobacterales bacterium]